MDVRKLAIALCALTLAVVGVVLYLRYGDEPDPRGKTDPALARQIEARHGPLLRALGIGSLGVDPQTDDVVVVFADGGHLGRKTAARLPGLAGEGACGRLKVGIAVGESVSAWGDGKSEGFAERLDCVVGEVASRAAELRQAD